MSLRRRLYSFASKVRDPTPQPWVGFKTFEKPDYIKQGFERW
jgi:hypothetical protein